MENCFLTQLILQTYLTDYTLREKLVQNFQVIILYVVMPKPSINNKLKVSLPVRTWVQALKSFVFLLQKLMTILIPALCREVHSLHWGLSASDFTNPWSAEQ